MSESAARAHLNKAADALEGHGASLSPAERVLIQLSLAQAEATLEVVEVLKNGIVLRQAEQLSRAIEELVKLQDRRT